MRAARLSEIVSVRRPVRVMVRGSEVLSYEPYCNERAGIEPLRLGVRNYELLANMQLNSELTTQIITRWSPQMEVVDASWIFVRKNPVTLAEDIYEIKAPPIHSQLAGRELMFLCVSGKNNPAIHSGQIK